MYTTMKTRMRSDWNDSLFKQLCTVKYDLDIVQSFWKNSIKYQSYLNNNILYFSMKDFQIWRRQPLCCENFYRCMYISIVANIINIFKNVSCGDYKIYKMEI